MICLPISTPFCKFYLHINTSPTPSQNHLPTPFASPAKKAFNILWLIYQYYSPFYYYYYVVITNTHTHKVEYFLWWVELVKFAGFSIMLCYVLGLFFFLVTRYYQFCGFDIGRPNDSMLWDIIKHKKKNMRENTFFLFYFMISCYFSFIWQINRYENILCCVWMSIWKMDRSNTNNHKVSWSELL